jgi:cation transport regulator
MSYEHLNDLPENIRGLSGEAQEIYREAFNNAWDNYRYRRNRRNRVSRHAVAHRIAWSAVKQKLALI